jgi:Fur family zinc uptake transcriptional regulator
MTDPAPDPAEWPESRHDHSHCQDKAVRIAERLCLERGVRLTPLRRKILELIWDNHQAIKAYDLLEKVRPFDRSIKPATIYRTLDFLLEQGLIHRVETLNAFIGCSHSEGQHEQLLLICERCQEVEERPGQAVMQAVARELEQAGFTLHRKAIEIHGLCARCFIDGT